jgi:hypothetical protein
MTMAECWICGEGRHEDCAGVTFDEQGEPNGACECWDNGHPQAKEEAT